VVAGAVAFFALFVFFAFFVFFVVIVVARRSPMSTPTRRTMPPRAVVVTRPTDLDQLLLRHGTRAQARFFLESRGQKLEDAVARHDVQEDAVHTVSSMIPLSWRRASVSRVDLDRFLFEADDVIIAVGQDGLVANVAKYLSGQPVVGVNPSKTLFDGVLVRHAPASLKTLLTEVVDGRPAEARTMAEAVSSDGQRLVALNELFVGHRATRAPAIDWRLPSAKSGTARRGSSSARAPAAAGGPGACPSVGRPARRCRSPCRRT